MAWVKRSIVILKKKANIVIDFIKWQVLASMVFASGNLNIANFSVEDANAITAIFTARDYAQRALDIEPNDLAAFYLDSL